MDNVRPDLLMTSQYNSIIQSVGCLLEAYRTRDRTGQETLAQELRERAEQGDTLPLYHLWLATRCPKLTAILAEGGWIPEFSVHLQVIQALAAADFEKVIAIGSGAVRPLVAALHSLDEELHSRAHQCLKKLDHPDAIDAIVNQWTEDRCAPLEEVIVTRNLVARRPPYARVLSALLTGRFPELVTEGREIVKPLVRVLREEEARLYDRARWVLLRLTHQEAIDELAELWVHNRDPELEAIIAQARYVADHPQWIRVLSALKADRAHVIAQNPTGLIALLVQSASDADPEVAGRARQTLEQILNEGKGQEELCDVVLEHGSPLAEHLAMERGLAPTDTRSLALFCFLTGQWDTYEALDFDMSILREAYEQGGTSLRERIARRARQAGRLELVELVAGVRHRRRMGQMTIREWDVTLSVLEVRRDWDTMWRLAQSAPAVWSVRALKYLDDLGWTPHTPDDKEGFERLVALAKACQGDAPVLIVAERPSASFTAHGRRVTALVISSYFENTLASASWDGAVRLWRMPEGKALARIAAHRHPITSIAVTVDGSLLATGCGAENTVCLWSLPEGRLFRALPGHSMGVASLAMSPDGTLLAVGCFSGLCHIWRLSDATLLHSLRGHRESVRCVTFSPDGELLATGGEDTTVRLWNVRDGRYLTTLGTHRMTVRSLTFSPDGLMLASGGFDDDVVLWHVPDRRHMTTLRGHRHGVYALAVSGDGRLLASGSWDGTVGLWILPHGKLGGVLDQHNQPVTCLATDPESRVLASGSHDNTITLWHFQSGIFRRPTTRKDMQRVEDLLKGTVDPLERTWLEFLLGQMQWRFRFDIEIDQRTSRIEVGEFDIEIEV